MATRPAYGSRAACRIAARSASPRALATSTRKQAPVKYSESSGRSTPAGVTSSSNGLRASSRRPAAASAPTSAMRPDRELRVGGRRDLDEVDDVGELAAVPDEAEHLPGVGHLGARAVRRQAGGERLVGEPLGVVVGTDGQHPARLQEVGVDVVQRRVQRRRALAERPQHPSCSSTRPLSSRSCIASSIAVSSRCRSPAARACSMASRASGSRSSRRSRRHRASRRACSADASSPGSPVAAGDRQGVGAELLLALGLVALDEHRHEHAAQPHLVVDGVVGQQGDGRRQHPHQLGVGALAEREADAGDRQHPRLGGPGEQQRVGAGQLGGPRRAACSERTRSPSWRCAALSRSSTSAASPGGTRAAERRGPARPSRGILVRRARPSPRRRRPRRRAAARSATRGRRRRRGGGRPRPARPRSRPRCAGRCRRAGGGPGGGTR